MNRRRNRIERSREQSNMTLHKWATRVRTILLLLTTSAPIYFGVERKKLELIKRQQIEEEQAGDVVNQDKEKRRQELRMRRLDNFFDEVKRRELEKLKQLLKEAGKGGITWT